MKMRKKDEYLLPYIREQFSLPTCKVGWSFI